MRASLEDNHDQERFDSKVGAATTWAEKYQEAAEFVYLNRDQDLLNSIIRRATLTACRTVTPAEARQLLFDEPELKRLETQGQWNLDPGVSALGQLLAAIPSDIRGPLITTNFDPLIEVSVREAGGQPAAHWLDDDGKIAASDQVGAIDVVHVHGLWRRGDTLHTQSQLRTPRPQLAGSLREALRGKLVVVLGYGGWMDSFTRSLLERVEQRDVLGMDITWASYSTLTADDFQSGILKELAALNRANFYGGVDVNKLLPQVVDRYTPKGAPSPTAGSLPRWTEVNAGFLQLATATANEQTRCAFFDGRPPDWTIAADRGVPRLSAVGRTRAHLKSLQKSSQKRIVLLAGPLGEGKSIALRQVVVDLIQESPDATILWREPGGTLTRSHLEQLPTDKRVILCSDEADLLVESLAALRADLEQRKNITLLLAAHERDWRNRGGFSRLHQLLDVVPVNGLASEDAAALVAAWEAAGTIGLGKLATSPSHEREGLLLAAANSPIASSGSLMGASLQLRYGDALSARVADMMSRMDNYKEVGSGLLSDAFLMICLLHATQQHSGQVTEPLSARILCEALSLESGALDYLVLGPLGQEAAAVAHGGYLYCRTSALAETALDVARDHRSDQLHSIIAKVVAAAVINSDTLGTFEADHGAVAYVSRRLGRSDESILAAQSAFDSGPRLSFATSLLATYRRYERFDEADEVGRTVLSQLDNFTDRTNLPGFFTDWATLSGQRGDAARNVLLDAFALDALRESAWTNNADKARGEAIKALLGLGVGLSKLAESSGDVRYVLGLQAVVDWVGRLAPTSNKDQRFLATHAAFVRQKLGATDRLTLEACRDRLQELLDDLAPATWKSVHASVDLKRPRLKAAYDLTRSTT
ncbi:P-loop NTPase [Modestobacter marinus]|uniref:P-loop NTPase n=1 Tax=Modestobacter marinus TaxID=477641 RepID=UPI001C97AC56|nr:SIR2 family protein [Modestobacter marinus]